MSSWNTAGVLEGTRGVVDTTACGVIVVLLGDADVTTFWPLPIEFSGGVFFTVEAGDRVVAATGLAVVGFVV